MNCHTREQLERVLFDKEDMTMTIGPSLELQPEQTPPDAPDCLHTFAVWLDLNPPPLSMVAGMLDLLSNELYRHGRIRDGKEVKHVVRGLRDEHDSH